MTLLDDDARTPFRDGDVNGFGYPIADSELAWQRSANQLGAAQVSQLAEGVDRGVFPAEGLSAAWDCGLGAMAIPVDDGGGGASLLAVVLATEALARHCGSTGMCFHMHQAAVQMLCRALAGATNERLLSEIARDRSLCTYATSEAGSGPRWWHMDEVARPFDGGYRIEATKSWATAAGHADIYIVPLRADPSAGPGELTLFAIHAGAGVVPIGTFDGSGLRGNSSTPVRFDLDVPASARIGPSGYGLEVLLAYGLPPFQLGLAAVYLGIAQAAFDAAAAHALTRSYADTRQPKAASETVQRRVAEMRLCLDQARALLYVSAGAATRKEQQGVDLVDLTEDTGFVLSLGQTKIAACEAAAFITDEALKICGGSAYKRGHIVERAYRDARAGSVMGPDDDSLKLLIGRRILGFPFPWRHG